MNGDSILAARFSARTREARAHLLSMMANHGLFPKDGWGIHDSVRRTGEGWELVLRPIHMRLEAPPDLECVVEITEQGEVDSHCVGD